MIVVAVVVTTLVWIGVVFGAAWLLERATHVEDW